MTSMIGKRFGLFGIFMVALCALILAPTTASSAQAVITPTPAGAMAQQPPPVGSGGSAASPIFSDLSFSTAPDGPPATVFAAGTQVIYARFNYANVPDVSSVRRNWYLNGVLYVTRTEAWNPMRPASGRISDISLFDYTSALPQGHYTVSIELVGFPSAQLIGEFTVGGGVVTPAPPVYPTPIPYPYPSGSVFYNVSTSTTPGGAPIINYPAGTRSIFLRFDYANMPVGALFRREWYRDGVLFRTAQEYWSAYWGPNGRLTHINLYDYYNGLTAGNYQVILSLPGYPSVRIETAFTIGGGPVGGGYFAGLTFSTTVNGPAYRNFYAYTRVIYARWQYVNPPVGVWLVRRWYRDGALWLTRREGWYRGGVGTTYTSIYDYQYGLLPGNYTVEITLEGVANSTVVAGFRVG